MSSAGSNLVTDDSIGGNSTGGSYTYDGTKYSVSKTGAYYGLYYNTTNLTVGQTYTFSWKFQKTSGTIDALGGHSESFDEIVYFVDGIKQSYTYSSATGTEVSLFNDNNVHEVVFVGEYTGTDTYIYAQPNRGSTTAVSFDVWDFVVKEGDIYGYSGESISQISNGTTGDKTLYARWQYNG